MENNSKNGNSQLIKKLICGEQALLDLEEKRHLKMI